MEINKLLKEYKIVVVNNSETLINKKTGKTADATLLNEYVHYQIEYKSQSHELNLSDKKQQYKKQAEHSKAYRDYLRLSRVAMQEVSKHLTSRHQVSVVSYILYNMSYTSNKLLTTYNTLAKATGASRATVSRTLRVLRKLKLAKTHASCIFISPTLVMYGSDVKYVRIYDDFYHSKRKWWLHPYDNDEFTYGNV